MDQQGNPDPEAEMEALIPIVLFMCLAGVLILRPVSKKLGLLLEALAKERMGQVARPAALDDVQLERITVVLDRLNNRLDLVDDRITFVERLVEERPRHRLTG
jgi:hypothetical protein